MRAHTLITYSTLKRSFWCPKPNTQVRCGRTADPKPTFGPVAVQLFRLIFLTGSLSLGLARFVRSENPHVALAPLSFTFSFQFH